MSFFTMAWEWLHSLPSLAKFALGIAMVPGVRATGSKLEADGEPAQLH
jgi:hypothetical protein